MKARITIENNFSIIFDAPESITEETIISILKENSIHLKKDGLPKFEVRLYKSFKNFSPVFASGQLSLNQNNSGKNYLVTLTGLKNPRWWKFNPVLHIKGIVFTEDRVAL